MLPQIVAGDTLSHTVSLADYPASDGWVLSYRLTPRTGSAITFNASASGDDHVIDVAASVTATWAAGNYTVGAFATLALVRHTVASECGQVVIQPNLATVAVGVELRTAAQVALDNVKATIQGRASSAVLEYEINGRQLRYLSHAELIALQSTLASEVKREQRAADIAAGIGNHSGKVYVRMARA